MTVKADFLFCAAMHFGWKKDWQLYSIVMNQHSAQIAAAVVVGFYFYFAVPKAAQNLKLWRCFKKPFRSEQMTQLKQYNTIM